LESTGKTDAVIVIGGGVIGLACAHYLSADGWDVTVIDRGRIGGGCSHANCGYVCPSHVLPLTEPAAIRLAAKSLLNPNAPFRVKPQFRPAHWNWMLQSARRCNERQLPAAGTHLKSILDSSISEYQGLMRQERLDCEWKENGLLYVLRSEEGMREFAKGDQFMADHFGVQADRVPAAGLQQLDPTLRDDLAGGFHYRMDASLRPDRLVSSWQSTLARKGVRFIEQCVLQSLQVGPAGIQQITTSVGDMRADQFVFALGAWSPLFAKMLRCRLPIQPGKGYSVTFQRPETSPRYPMLFPEHKVGVSPFENGFRLGSMMEFAGYDESIPRRRIDQLRHSAEPYLRIPIPETEQETWYGWRPMTWDSLPIIGGVPKMENAYLATGHNMIGVSLAPATGRLVAELVGGRVPHLDPEPYSPSRF